MNNDKVILQLSCPEDPSDSMTIVIDVMETTIAKKWFRLLAHDLSQEYCLIEKNFSFLGFLGTPRDLNFLCRQLEKYVQVINQFSATGQWKCAYTIDIKLAPEDLLRDPEVSRRLLNELHHHFEILQGQQWDLSEYYQSSTNPVKFAIKQINQLCHEMEYLFRSHFQGKKDPEGRTACTIVSLLTEEEIRENLTPEDYEHFKLSVSFGDVILHYCQSGKNHLEAFLDDDQVIDRKNISTLRYCSSSFVICWMPPMVEVGPPAGLLERFHAWLKRNDYDPSDKSLGLGQCKIGHISVEQFPCRELSQIHALLGRYSNITKISLEGHGLSMSRDFPEFWTDPNFDEIQLDMLYD